MLRKFVLQGARRSTVRGIASYKFTEVEPDFTESDPYKLLQVSRDAEFDSIRDRFFELGRKYHGDIQRGDSTKFRKLWAAYESIVTDKQKVEKEWDGKYHSYLQSWSEPETHIFRQIFELTWLQKTAVRQAELDRREGENELDGILQLQYHTVADWFAILQPMLSAKEEATWKYWLQYWRNTWAQRLSNKQNRDAAWVTNNFRRVDADVGTDVVQVQVGIEVRNDKEMQNWSLWEKFFFEVAARKAKQNANTIRSSRAKGAFHLSANSPYCQEFES